MATARGMNSFLKTDFPARAPKRHGQGLPDAHQGSHSMTWGPGLTCRTSWPEVRRRRIVAQGACNRPAVTRPSTFAATSGQEGEPPHKERATAPRLCAPAQGACNRPAVTRPSTFAATSGQEGEPPHKERATAPRLCAPSSSPRPMVKKANRHTRSVLPPRGSAPLVFAALVETSGRKGGPPCKKRATAPRSYTLSASLQPAV